MSGTKNNTVFKVCLLSFMAGGVILSSQLPIIGTAGATGPGAQDAPTRQSALIEHYRDDLAPPRPETSLR